MVSEILSSITQKYLWEFYYPKATPPRNKGLSVALFRDNGGDGGRWPFIVGGPGFRVGGAGFPWSRSNTNSDPPIAEAYDPPRRNRPRGSQQIGIFFGSCLRSSPRFFLDLRSSGQVENCSLRYLGCVENLSCPPL